LTEPPEKTTGQTIVAEPRMHHRYWKMIGIALIAVMILAAGVRWWIGPKIAVETIVRRDFVQSVVASGHVETAHRVDIGAQITGKVLLVPVREGQQVAAGDLLVELESAEYGASERQAGVAVAQAEERRRQMRDLQVPVAEQTLRQAEANLLNARSLLRRNQDLSDKGFISKAALSEFQRAVEVADAQVQTGAKQLASARPAGSDFLLAEGAVAEARANFQLAGARTRYTRITAPVSGTLIARNIEAGDVVQAGKVLMSLSPGGATQLVVEIDERNLRLIALGQQALVSPDAYPQQRFSALLAYINPGINVLTGAVQVKLDVPMPPPELRQDMTISVDIEVARRPKALLAPASVVHDIDAAAPWVLALEHGRAVKHPVQIGLRTGGFVEVISGLAEGDAVIPTSQAIVDGARVRVLSPAR